MLHICNFSSCLETSQRFVYLIGLYKEPGFGFGYEHFFLAARAFTAVCGPSVVVWSGGCSLAAAHMLLTSGSSLVVEPGLSSCDAWAQLN